MSLNDARPSLSRGSGPAPARGASPCTGKREGGPATSRVPALFAFGVRYGEQRAGAADVSGCVQSGPSPVFASGALIIASGPAL